MVWTVALSHSSQKQFKRLGKRLQDIVILLLNDLEQTGPVRGDWPNYGKLSDNCHHCHLKKGKPCYVAIWEVKDKEIKLIEVKYLGTHEKASY